MSAKTKIILLSILSFTLSCAYAQDRQGSVETVTRFYNGWKELSTLKDHSTGAAQKIECYINECTEGGENCEEKSQVSVPREIDFLTGNNINGSITIGPYISDLENFIGSTNAIFSYNAPKFFRKLQFRNVNTYDVYTVAKSYQWNGKRKDLVDTVFVNLRKGNKISGIKNQYGGSRDVKAKLNSNISTSNTDLGIQISTLYTSGNHEEALDLYKKNIKSDFTFGGGLSYDQHFPLGFSLVGSIKMFMLGLDVGINMDSKKYLVEKMDFKDIMNYKYEKNNYDPLFFAALSPALYFDYISVGCGLGFVAFGEDWETSNWNTDSDGRSSGSSQASNASLIKFIARPQIKGYIPLTRSCKLSVGGGYDIIPGFSSLNGFNASLGLQWDIDNWDFLF